MTQRPNITGIVVGAQGTGKTTYVTSLLNATDRSRGVLIVCLSEKIDFKQYPKLPFESEDGINLQSWNGNGSYVLIHHNFKQVAKVLARKAFNCFVLFEDASGYMRFRTPDDILQLVTDQRHRNLDLFFNFHSLDFVPHDLLTVTHFLTIFKSKSAIENNVKILERKLVNANAIAAAYDRVNRHPDRHYHETITINEPLKPL